MGLVFQTYIQQSLSFGLAGYGLGLTDSEISLTECLIKSYFEHCELELIINLKT